MPATKIIFFAFIANYIDCCVFTSLAIFICITSNVWHFLSLDYLSRPTSACQHCTCARSGFEPVLLPQREYMLPLHHQGLGRQSYPDGRPLRLFQHMITRLRIEISLITNVLPLNYPGMSV
jgi:hypothetical protein